MKHFCGYCVLLLALGIHAAQPLDRSIGAQPTYDGKPHYLLLHFGQPATRVWVAVDAKNLYIDRNGDGSLTGAGEKISGTAGKPLLYLGGSVSEKSGAIKHEKISLHRRGEKVLDVSVFIGGKIEQIATGELFESPEKAVMLHFNGPLQVQAGIEELSREYENKFVCMIGTPGVGEGSFSSFMHETIEKAGYVRAEFTWPAKAGGAPFKQSIDLKERCCGNLFYGQIRVPLESGEGNARIELTFVDLKSMTVAPSQVELPVVK